MSANELEGMAAARAFRVLFALAPFAICAVRLDGRIFAANPATARLMGVATDEVGQPAISDLTHPDDLGRTSELFRKLAAGREEAQVFEARFVRRDGKAINARVTSLLVRDETRGPAFVIGVVEPVDEVAPLQEQIAAARTAAHDLNNFLTVIVGHAELAIARLPVRDEARWNLEEIQSAAETSVSLVRRILAPGVVTRPKTEAVDVNHAILGMRDTTMVLVGSGIRTVLELDPAHPRARADEEGLTLALANIVRNASEAMPDGGTLTIRTQSNAFVRIAVTDTGTGIAAELLGHLSEPGFTTKAGGHGIGLASVRQFAEAYGGRLTIESTPGKGTTVTLWLRSAPAAASG